MARAKRYLQYTKWTSFIGIVSIFILVIALPFFLKEGKIPTNNRSNATAATTLSFGNPTLTIGNTQAFSEDVLIDPGTNRVSYMTLVVSYDSSKIVPDTTSITPNAQIFSQTLDGPSAPQCTGTTCTISIAISVGSDPTKAISTKSTAATVHMKAVAIGTTTLSFDPTTQVLSIAATDKANENVMSTSQPASITVQTGATTPVPSGAQPTTNPSGLTTANIELALPGISIGNNTTPIHPTRNISLSFVNTSTQQITEEKDAITYDGTNAFKNPAYKLGTLPTGTYDVYAIVEGYLIKRIAPGMSVTTGSSITITNTLIAGDIAPINATGYPSYGDNSLDILDYTALINCFGTKATTSSCLSKTDTDLNDDGNIDGIDYNILLRSFATGSTAGDTIPTAGLTAAPTVTLAMSPTIAVPTISTAPVPLESNIFSIAADQITPGSITGSPTTMIGIANDDTVEHTVVSSLPTTDPNYFTLTLLPGEEVDGYYKVSDTIHDATDSALSANIVISQVQGAHTQNILLHMWNSFVHILLH